MKAKVSIIELDMDDQERITAKIVGGGYIVMPNTLNLVLGDEVEVEFTLLPSAADLDAHAAEEKAKEATA